MRRAFRYAIWGVGTAALLAWWGTRDPIPQDVAYHSFADRRSWLGIPNTFDVLSNLAFLAVGVWGILVLSWSKRGVKSRMFLDASEKIPYLAFFVGVALISIGSGYYHLWPNNDTLVWDRIPMTIAFVAFLSAAVMERVSVKAGLRLLAPLLILGALTVFYWDWTESVGRGDLRPYVFVQFYPMLAVPGLIVLFPARYTGAAKLLAAVLIYFVAKALDLSDKGVFAATGWISGHTLKHVVAACAIVPVIWMLRTRRPVVKR